MAQKKEEFKIFAARGPELTVLTDHALKTEETYRDSFNLRYRLGPVYDILRYPGTKTPMAIAVYGDWGAGKTTAMKWLHGLIDEWNENGQAEDKIKIRPVWFYPWKYDNKEDVWRGLIAEVIWKAIDVKTASVKTVTEAFKMLGMFIGKSAIDIISAAKMNVPGFEISGEALKQIAKNFKDASHPEKQYLNQYEDALKNWVEKSLEKDQRMVIFIDDLDRCMPEIALQVLEALKLYFKIEKLFFVVGVDKTVIDKLVKEHYKKLGLDEEKSGNYLAKMFQVEVQVEPSEQQISDFLDEKLNEISYWREPHLSEDERGIFRELIFKLAERNPREVKRLINSALMMGAGAVMMKAQEGKQDGIKFNQGLQLFFVRKILDEIYTMSSLVGSERGNEFFRQWSKIVCEGREKDEDFPCTVKVPEDFGRGPLEEGREAEAVLTVLGKEVRKRVKKGGMDLSFAPPAYYSLLQNLRFSGLLNLLGDEDIGKLMLIPYPTETEASEISAVVGTSKDTDIIREAIARKLGKKPDELNAEDYREIKELDLSNSEISDLELIKRLSSLQSLDISSTQVSNLEPIRGLSSLQELNLGETQVSDLEPIKGLGSLQVLRLSDTQVSNLEPIKGLGNLQELGLNFTQVSDLEPIKELSSLEVLYLSDTQVRNLEPTKDLNSLQRLDFCGTKVRNLGPIKGLNNLKTLYLMDTQVSNLEPIRGLGSLQELNLGETQVSDLEPIKELGSLQVLYLGNTQVRNLGPIKGLGNLQELGLNFTQVSDLEPIKELSSLQVLYLSNTQVRNLEPINGLSSLKQLYLNDTQVSDLEPIKGLLSLGWLKLWGTQVSDLEPIKELSSLQELDLRGTQVSDLEPIKGLSSLRWLDLGGTQVSDLEPIKGISSLEVIDLGGKQVSEEQVEELQKALPKVKIFR